MFFFFKWGCGHQPHATTPYPQGPWYLPFVCQLHWNQSGMDDPTNTWAAASTGFEFTDASKPVTWQKYAFQKTGVL
jgi:hypothetical protein